MDQNPVSKISGLQPRLLKMRVTVVPARVMTAAKRPGMDGIGEVLDLGGGEVPFLRLLDSRQLDALAGRARDEP